MISIIGPAKTIDTSPHGITDKHTRPQFRGQAEEMVNFLRGFTPDQLKDLMKVSEKLATLTFERYASWRPDPPGLQAEGNPGTGGLQALLAFSGEVFNGLKARTLEESDLEFAQEHVRILSGLYGVLRPLDVILPYRLEMGTRLKGPWGNNLYEFWKEIIPQSISDLTGKLDPPVLINLASNEYFKSIRPGSFPHRVITPVFRESAGKGYRNVTIYAKKARGMMLRFIIKNRINDPEYLKAFDEEAYGFNSHLSGENEWVFTR